MWTRRRLRGTRTVEIGTRTVEIGLRISKEQLNLGLGRPGAAAFHVGMAWNRSIIRVGDGQEPTNVCRRWSCISCFHAGTPRWLGCTGTTILCLLKALFISDTLPHLLKTVLNDHQRCVLYSETLPHLLKTVLNDNDGSKNGTE